MRNNSIFSFRGEKENGDYDIYLFNDFSGTEEDIDKNIFYALDEIRQEIHSPNTIFIICVDDGSLQKSKHKSRFTNSQKIEYIKYQDIRESVFKIGVSQIVENNKVVQYAPHGTKFKKTSGEESHYFIKASLSLSEYPQICFLALCAYHKITIKMELSSIKKFYIDTSSIIPLIQALIYYQNTVIDGGQQFHPEIINFKSYSENSFDFNVDNPHTIISASSSGNLQKKIEVHQDKCTTIFLPESINKECLFKVPIKEQQPSNLSLIPIALTAEDFSLEYSKSKEVVITKDIVEKLDEKKLIRKLLNNEFTEESYMFQHDEVCNEDLLKFNESFFVENKDSLKKFTQEIFKRCLLSKIDNYVVYKGIICESADFEITNGIEVKEFLDDDSCEVKDGVNVIVCLDQSDKNELLKISRKLRHQSVFNITYVIGILLTESIAQSKNLQNNICFNDTDYKYGFYCYLDLSLLTINKPDINNGKLSNGFIFYEGKNSEKLDNRGVYLVFCMILEFLRNDNKLSDNIFFHHVISPKNFSRFNDSLLQLSILSAAKGRELNFCSNESLSYEMLNVIIDIMNENYEIGKVFIKFLKDKKIRLTQKHFEKIELKFPELFKEENTI